jgi:hypothetical protein
VTTHRIVTRNTSRFTFIRECRSGVLLVFFVVALCNFISKYFDALVSAVVSAIPNFGNPFKNWTPNCTRMFPSAKKLNFFKAMSSGKATFLNNKAGSCSETSKAMLAATGVGGRSRKKARAAVAADFLCGDNHRTEQHDIQKISKDDAYETPTQKSGFLCFAPRF